MGNTTLTTYKMDPTLKSLGKRLDSILFDIARLPLSPTIEELLKRLDQDKKKGRTPSSCAPSIRNQNV
jgi:hypothetical protein